MSDDLLARATRALRITTGPSSEGMEAMLARLERRRVFWLPARARTRAAIFALAATFVGMGAWAGATGRLPQWTRVFSIAEPAPAPPAKKASVRNARRMAPVAPLPSELASTEAAPVASGTSSPAPAPGTSNAVANRRPAVPSAGVPVKPDAAVDVNALYRDAHRLHFGGGDFGATVAAWDRYLAAAGPGARMGLEARYNRAIALARAGRKGEAIAALRPFAGGEYGGYRRDEARRLLDSLQAPSP